VKKQQKTAFSGPIFRRTLKNPGGISGVGLHSGVNMDIVFHPAPEGTGLVFYKKVGRKDVMLPVHLRHVLDTSLAVTLGNADMHVQTVEHLLYALFVEGITDLVMEVQGGSEIPILDGSAKEFLDLFGSLETHELNPEWEPIRITRPVSVSDGNRYIVGLPADDYLISYSIDYPHPHLKNQYIQLSFTKDVFRRDIGQARTFGFLKDIEYLRSKGLAQGGSEQNALIYTPTDTLNEPRFDRESLHHKVLDLIGDLALIGRPLIGHVLASRAGHALDVAFGKKILKNFTKESELDFFISQSAG